MLDKLASQAYLINGKWFTICLNRVKLVTKSVVHGSKFRDIRWAVYKRTAVKIFQSYQREFKFQQKESN